jgi:serine/threonine protein phosphatase 1
MQQRDYSGTSSWPLDLTLMEYAIADIHGCNKTFRKLLERSRLTAQDTLYLLGDYIDRGPDSRGVLQQIMSLIEGGYGVRPLRGNHEDMILRTYRQQHDDMSWWWLKEWGDEVLKSFNAQELQQIPETYWSFLGSLPLIAESDRHLFVHGCFDMETVNPLQDSSPFVMLWGSSRHLNGLNGKQLVSGHVVTPLHQIRESLNTGHILLDNGCCSDHETDLGNLVMLNLDTNELLLQPLIDKISLPAWIPQNLFR